MSEETYQILIGCIPCVVGMLFLISVQLFLFGLVKRVRTVSDYYKFSNRLPAYIFLLLGVGFLVYAMLLPSNPLRLYVLIGMLGIQITVLVVTERIIIRRLDFLRKEEICADFNRLLDLVEKDSEFIKDIKQDMARNTIIVSPLLKQICEYADDPEWVTKMRSLSRDELARKIMYWYAEEENGGVLDDKN